MENLNTCNNNYAVKTKTEKQMLSSPKNHEKQSNQSSNRPSPTKSQLLTDQALQNRNDKISNLFVSIPREYLKK